MPKKLSDDNVEIFRESQKRKNATTSKVSYRIQKAYDIFDKKKINTILDIGYQTESLFKLFPREIEKYGMDLVKPRGDLNNINFLLCDVSYGFPFKDLSFDAIFAGEIIEHLLDTDFLIEEIYRVLRKNGQLVLTTPNSASSQNLIKWIRMKQFAHNDYRLGQNGHVRYYSPKALAQQLSGHGFRIELQTSSEDIITKLLMMKHFSKLAKVSLITKSKFFPMRGECLIVKALKK